MLKFLFRELMLFAVRADDIDVFERFQRAAPPVGQIFLAQGEALRRFLGRERALARNARQLADAVFLFFGHRYIVPNSSRFFSNAPRQCSMNQSASGRCISSIKRRVCSSAERNSRLPALRSSMH